MAHKLISNLFRTLPGQVFLPRNRFRETGMTNDCELTSLQAVLESDTAYSISGIVSQLSAIDIEENREYAAYTIDYRRRRPGFTSEGEAAKKHKQ